MNRSRIASLVLTAAFAVASVARAEVAIVKTDDVKLNLGGTGQVIGVGENVNDLARADQRAYVFLKEARIRMNGGFKAYTFNLEFALGGEDTVATPSPGVGLSLLDLAFNIPIPLGTSYIRAGQFKVPYGREGLTYDSQMTFNSKSIASLGSVVGYDVGLTLNLRNDIGTIIAGVFTGGGRDVPQTYIPEKMGVPLLVLRAGVGNVDEDPYYLRQNDIGGDKLKAAFFLNAMYTKDTLIGHSSVLNVKLADKSLLLNGNWNPFIAKAPLDQGAYWQVGADGALRQPLGEGMGLSAEAEVNWSGFANKYGALHTLGARAQGNFYYRGFEAGLRYAVLMPDKAFSVTKAAAGATPAVTAKITPTGEPIHEITPAVTYYILGQNLKVTLDFPILVGVPVVNEKNIGAYVLSEMPNQTTSAVGTDAKMSRQTVEEARLMLQGQF